MAQYELITEGSSTLPFLIERDTGILTTIAVFHDKVGEMYNARIRVYDNYRRVPSLETICDLRVCNQLLYSALSTFNVCSSGVCCER